MEFIFYLCLTFCVEEVTSFRPSWRRFSQVRNFKQIITIWLEGVSSLFPLHHTWSQVQYEMEQRVFIIILVMSLSLKIDLNKECGVI